MKQLTILSNNNTKKNLGILKKVSTGTKVCLSIALTCGLTALGFAIATFFVQKQPFPFLSISRFAGLTAHSLTCMGYLGLTIKNRLKKKIKREKQLFEEINNKSKQLCLNTDKPIIYIENIKH